MANNHNTVAVPNLTATNYTSWAIKMQSVMDAQGLWEAIKPTPGSAVNVKKSKMARAFIFQALPDDVLLQVAKHKEPKDVWEALRLWSHRAERVQKVRIQTLKSEFEKLRMNETETIDEYAGKISGLVSKLRSLGSSLDDSTLVKKLFLSVPKRFIKIVAVIEQFCDLETMPFEEAIGRLKMYEERVKCHNSYRRGHGGARDKGNIRCYRCDKFGHFASECKTLNGTLI